MPISSNIQPSAGKPLEAINAELRRTSDKTHWKKMETFGRSTGSDSYGIDAQLKQLGDQYKGMFDRVAASGKDPTSIQVEYDRAKAELMQTKGQLDLVQRLGLGPEATQRASAMIMGVPASAFAGPGGVTSSATGLSPSQQKSYTEYFAELAEQTVINPRGWGKTQRKRADPDMLKEMFLNEWDIQNLDDPRNVNKRLGFIQSWKTAMSENRHTKKAWGVLEKDDPEVRMALAPPSQLTDVFRRKVQGASPLGRSIASGLPKQAPQPIRQYSQSRGQTRVSYDGGTTWQTE